MPQGYTLGNISSETKEECLRSELQCPDADLLYTAFSHGTVVKDITGEGIVHLNSG
jgi:hypothetical protein